MRIYKKIGIGLGVFIVLIAIGIAIPPPESTKDVSNDVQVTPKTYTGSIDNLLPTKVDIGTSWELKDRTSFIDHPTDDSSIGLLDKVQQEYY